MNKLSIICAFALVFGFMLCPVQAADLTMDFDGDGVGDTAWNLDPSTGLETVTVDVYADNWDYVGEPVFGVKMFLTIDNPTKVQLNSATPYDTANGGIWDPAFSLVLDQGGGVWQLEVADFNCEDITDKLKLFTLELQCIGQEDVSSPNIHLDAITPAGALTPGGPACGGPHPEDAVSANVELDQMPPACTLTIIPDPTTVISEQTRTFSVNATESCTTPPQYEYSDDCVNGSVDPATGVFTATTLLGSDENCSVSVTDEANTGACSTPGSDCNADLTITKAADCRIDIKVVEPPVKIKPGDINLQVPVGMKNPSDEVVAIETLLLDEADSLICTGCIPDPVRASDFICLAFEQTDMENYGRCKVIMVPLSGGVILEGDGAVLTVDYQVVEPIDGCIDLEFRDTLIADINQDPVKVCEIEETDDDICSIRCGDVYPREDCGDGVINIFDILDEIDFVLGILEPSDCQALQANVPTSLPPLCDDPDDEINIFDVLVLIDLALGKSNCCDYYYFGEM